MRFPARFRERVCDAPDAVALLETKGRSISRRDLLLRAVGVGAALADAGIGREDRVGLLIPKSIEYVAALLGTWEAAAAIVPLDPQLPDERLRIMCDDAGVKAVLTTDMLRERARALSSRVIAVDELASALEVGPAPDVRDETLAWVIYTSGSTGRPKGVAVEHRGFVPMLDAQIAAFQLATGDTALMLLSTAFDASLSDLGTALLSGARLVIPEATFEVAGLPSLLERHGVTHADLPPALLRVFEPEAFPESLRTIVIGGEPTAPEIVRKWARGRRVVNVYGPTEATICVSLTVCDPTTWRRPLIGEPIAGTRLKIVADALGSASEGELLLGGPLLARGYANAEEPANRRFIVLEGERWYRTGDRVVQREDGIEFLGRIDRQLKLNGRLVAPEEIELALGTMAGVSRALVTTRGTMLVAHVEVKAPHPSESEMKERLRVTLPEWMLPRRIELCEALPTTASGKIDTRALDEGTPTLLTLLRRVTGNPNVTEEDSLESAGLDSLGRLELLAACEAEGIALAGEALLSEATITSLMARPGVTKHSLSMEEIRRRVGALQVFGHVAEREPGSPRVVLLTGATGFLGSRLLDEILGRGMRVVCLVRAEDDARAAARIGVEHPALEVIAGDCALPRFGLELRAWTRLADEVDTVVHCAARVHVLEPWDALVDANLLAVRQAIDFARSGKLKTIHHASTLSVFVSSDRNSGVALENDDLSDTREIHGGYAQTKVAAELLLREAGVPVVLHRLGLITGDRLTGEAARSDFLTMFLRGIARLGCFPRGGEELGIDVTPVDWAAAAMGALIDQDSPSRSPFVSARAKCARAPLRVSVGQARCLGAQRTRCFHLAGARPVRAGEIVAALRSIGVRVEEVEPEAFAARATEGDAVSAATLLGLCRALSPDAFERHRALDLFQTTGITFDASEAQSLLDPLGLERPEADHSLLCRYARHALELHASAVA